MTASQSNDLQRLAEMVQARRLQLHLSLARAAEMAGISKDTWKRVEAAEPVRTVTYAKIESILGWTGDSTAKTLDGGEPTLIENDADGGPASTEDFTQALTSALVSVADNLTGVEIRDIARRTTEELQRRGLV